MKTGKKNETMKSFPKEGDMILAEDAYYSMDDFRTMRNNNVLATGVAGAGKTRYLVIPNILQATGSYLISDPKGNLRKKYGPYLEEKGYHVVSVDFIRPERSDSYNPLRYIRTHKDVLKVAHMLSYNQSTVRGGTVDIFWEQASELLFSALIAYLLENMPECEHTIESVTKMILSLNVNENNPSARSALDRLFAELENRNPKSYALKQYQKFRVAAGRTLRSIQISCNVKLNAYDFPEMHEMMQGDSIDFTKIGREKTAVFVNVSDTDRSMDDLVNLFFSQAMNEITYYADEHCEGNRLPIPVRFILDDFATNVVIEDFPRMIASIRSRGVSVMLCIQDESQLEATYKEHGQTIINNCDTYLYLGGNDERTVAHVSTRMDIPRKRVLEMPVGTGFLMRRGEPSRQVKTFDLERFEKKIFRKDRIPAKQHMKQSEPDDMQKGR